MSDEEELKAKLAEYEATLLELEGLDDEGGDILKEELNSLIALIREKLREKDEGDGKDLLVGNEIQNSNGGGGEGNDGDQKKELMSLAQMALDSGFSVGLLCESIWPEDNEWYSAKIESIGDNGVTVRFTGYNDVLVVHPSQIRHSKDILNQIKRKGVSLYRDGVDEVENKKIPQNLVILSSDDAQMREFKKRQLRVWKQRQRREQMDIRQTKNILSWQQFKKEVEKKSRLGTIHMRKESIFKTPDGGKVGVAGSGKVMTRSSQFEHIKRQSIDSIPR